MFGETYQEQVLAELFFDQFGERGGLELHRFLQHLEGIELPFRLVDQVRKKEYPGYPGFECGLPPSYYYFVPGSCYGGHKCFPDDPVDPSFVAATDGIGLNFGCPLRLRRAVEFLLSLDNADQNECRDGLATATKHLATVEELVSGSIWNRALRIGRPAANKGKSFDWHVTFSDLTLNVECKFLPSNWPALVDRGSFRSMKGALAEKASKQLPATSNAGSINVAAVCGIAPVDDGFRAFCHSELQEYKNVDVVVYRDIAGQAAVFSTCATFASEVHKHINPWRADEFRGFASVVSNRPEQARREQARDGKNPNVAAELPTDLVEISVECLSPRKVYVLPPMPCAYRFNLEQRLETGEPIFQWVPPFLE